MSSMSRFWTHNILLQSPTQVCSMCGKHLSNSCQKSPNLPAKCALCVGDHPANYRGCPIHKEFQASLQSKKTYDNRKNVPHPTIDVKRDTTSNTNLNSQLPISLIPRQQTQTTTPLALPPTRI